MAQRVVLFLLWLVNRSFGAFPSQINIGKCFAAWKDADLGVLCVNQTRGYNLIPERSSRSAGALRNDRDQLDFYWCCTRKTAEYLCGLKLTEVLTVIAQAECKWSYKEDGRRPVPPARSEELDAGTVVKKCMIVLSNKPL